MTSGESQFVFTVINALYESLKSIKEAEVFFFFFLYASAALSNPTEGRSYCTLRRSFVASRRYIWLTVHTIAETVGVKFMQGI